MTRRIPDDLVHEFAAVAPYDRLKSSIEAHFGGLVDCISLPADTPLYLRGTMNDWGTSLPLRHEGARYVAEVQLPAGRHQFKLATADWNLLALGQTDNAALKPTGGMLRLGAPGQDITFQTDRAATWLVTLDRLATGAPRLTITPR